MSDPSDRGKIFILSGPSGSGKTTLHNLLFSQPELSGLLVKSVSATTRSKRRGEREGIDYFFLDQNDFLRKIDAGEFLEWQKVFENYYGTPRQNVERQLNQGQNVLLCIDVEGAKVVKRLFPNAVTIFVTTPSWNVLEERLKARGTEKGEGLNLRLKTARRELEEAKNYRYVLINDNLQETSLHLEDIIRTELPRSAPRQKN